MTAHADLVIHQGEDYAIQIIWTTDLNEGYQVTHPIRMQARAASGQTAFECASVNQAEEQPDTTQPTLVYSTEGGVIQIIVPASVTTNLPTGKLYYDVFASYVSTTTSFITGEEMSSTRRTKILNGTIHVEGRVTKNL